MRNQRRLKKLLRRNVPHAASNSTSYLTSRNTRKGHVPSSHLKFGSIMQTLTAFLSDYCFETLSESDGLVIAFEDPEDVVLFDEDDEPILIQILEDTGEAEFPLWLLEYSIGTPYLTLSSSPIFEDENAVALPVIVERKYV